MAKFKVVRWVIHSKSQGGFWNSKYGWSYYIVAATKYSDNKGNFPSIGTNDCEWLPYEYDEN